MPRNRASMARRPVGQDGAAGDLTTVLTEKLCAAGLRPTRQRLALAALLFDGVDRHVTAEHLYAAARDAGDKVSLATVYNCLNCFRDAGLLREVTVEPGRSYFDTNMHDHHHFFIESSGELMDIPATQLRVVSPPPPPPGLHISRVDVIVRLNEGPQPAAA